jgi:hypothetical protein
VIVDLSGNADTLVVAGRVDTTVVVNADTTLKPPDTVLVTTLDTVFSPPDTVVVTTLDTVVSPPDTVLVTIVDTVIAGTDTTVVITVDTLITIDTVFVSRVDTVVTVDTVVVTNVDTVVTVDTVVVVDTLNISSTLVASVSSLNLTVGQSATLTVTTQNPLGFASVPSNVTWLSSNPSIASTTSSGTVRGESVGQATIFAVTPGLSATIPTTVTTNMPPPPPPPPSTAFTPNEPTGMVRVLETDFSVPSQLNFTGPFGSQSGYVLPSAPYSPSEVVRFVYPGPDGQGFYTGNTRNDLAAGTVKVYIAYNWRLSPGFNIHPGNLKQWYFYRDPSCCGSLVIGMLPSTSDVANGPFILNGQPQTSGGPALMQPNGTGAPALARDQWFHTEILAVMNTSPGSRDGILKVWVNGVVTLNYTNVVYSEGSQPLEWRVVALNPYFGGNQPGLIIPTQYLYVDHTVVSASSTR